MPDITLKAPLAPSLPEFFVLNLILPEALLIDPPEVSKRLPPVSSSLFPAVRDTLLPVSSVSPAVIDKLPPIPKLDVPEANVNEPLDFLLLIPVKRLAAPLLTASFTALPVCKET